MLRVMIILVLMLVLPEFAQGQFYFPLPAPVDAVTVCAVKVFEQEGSSCQQAHSQGALDSVLAARRAELIEELGDRELVSDSAAAIAEIARSMPYRKEIVPLRHPFQDWDKDVRQYFHQGTRFFRDVTALVREDRIYIASSLISGLLGRTYFDFSLAKAVASTTREGEDTEEFNDAISDMYRLVNNGGSAAMHILSPIYASGGTVSQRTVGMFAQMGGLGALDDVEEMDFTLGVGAEFLIASAIRDIDYEEEGELFLGIRGVFQYVFSDDWTIDDVQDSSVPALQISAGIRGGEDTRFTVLYTLLENHFRDVLPRFQFSLQVAPS